VRDVAAGYVALAEHGRPGQHYLICSGKAVSIESILRTLIGMISVEVEVALDPERMRPSETPRLVGSFAKIEQDTGWRPEIGLERSLRDALDDWRGKLNN
jgi:GDP-4-dehydro-6-deoxy-D-mannose reductase